MSTFKNGVKATVILFSIVLCGLSIMFTMTRQTPTIASVQPELHTPEFQRAFFLAAEVYGKAGCGDQGLAEMTARHSIRTGLPPQLIAAQASTESTCNPLAVSNRGAVGLMQIVPKTFGKQYDFSKINLFNPEDNMRVGTDILTQLVKDHGIKGGLYRYYGTGVDGIGLGGSGYADKVLQLSGKTEVSR